MKIVHIMPQIGIGGAETQLFKLITHSNGHAVQHEVLYYSDSRDQEGFKLYASAKIPLTRVARTRTRPLQFLSRLAQAIRSRQPDLVHCWLSGGAIWGRLAAIRAGIPHIVVAYRGVELSRPAILSMVERLTAGRVQHCANSNACARGVASQLRLPVGAFRVVYNGVDTEKLALAVNRCALRAELGLADGAKLIVNVGRLTATKNHVMLLRVAQHFTGEPPAHFVVVGHGELEHDLLRKAEELGVSDHVHFLGLRHDIPAILKSADVFCYTSLHEGFPNALLEAMAAGLPIVTTGFAGADELIEQERSGLIVAQNDVMAMVEGVRRYLQEPARAMEYGASAARAAGERFAMHRMVDDTMALYHELMMNQR